MEPVLSKQADHVADVIIRALSEIKGQVHTLTMDNGNEFAQHKRVAKALLAKVYFAHPYCAWERGANENTNGLLRQYFPKGTTDSRYNSVVSQAWVLFALEVLGRTGQQTQDAQETSRDKLPKIANPLRLSHQTAVYQTLELMRFSKVS